MRVPSCLSRAILTAAVVFLACSMAPALVLAQPGGGGSTGYICTYQDHYSQIPEELRPCLAGYVVQYGVLLDEYISEVTTSEHYIDSFTADALCSPTIPCDYVHLENSYTYQKRSLRRYAIEGTASISRKIGLGVDLVVQIDIEPSWVIEINGQVVREEETTQTAQWNYLRRDCDDQIWTLREIRRRVAGNSVWGDVWTWDLDWPCPIGNIETECVTALAEGEARRTSGWGDNVVIIPCCDEPECCGRECPW